MKLFGTTTFMHLSIKILLLAVCFANSINAQTLTVDTYTSSTTWVVPACVTSITVRAWGGGGAGGGASATDRNGGGGGGGAYCTRVETVTPGETITITVGAGGLGVSANTGGAGGFSQVSHAVGPVIFCRAAGGAGGQRGANSTSAGAGGAGGAIASNIPAGTGFRGGNGGASDPNTALDRSGGGGGGAGSGSNGGDGGIITAGAAGSPGGGAGGDGVGTSSSTGANGFPGSVLGGGGGGSTVFSSGTRAGAAGANGQVTITYTATGCEPALSIFNYSTVGTYNWVVPVCVNFVTVEAWGGGGGGGGNIAVVSGGSETCTGAGGGAGGGYAARTYAVVPGQSYTIVVGAGGTAGPAGVGTTGGITTPAGNGGAGGNSTFSGPATVGPGTLTGTGGNGGSGAGGRNTTGGTCLNINGAAGAGNFGLNGTVNYRGGNGAPGLILSFSTDRSGGAGGVAGPGGNGGNAPSAGTVGVGVDPPGGIGNPPGGNGGNGRTYNTTGTAQLAGGNGVSFGGGGGGSLIHINTFGVATAVGGAGAQGEVRLTYNTSCPLPIELISFSGTNETRYNELDWQTASENNNDYFTLERSVDGENWVNTVKIDGAGTSTLLLNYEYQDYLFTHNSINYYRLSQTDFDGTKKFAGNIVSIDNREYSKQVVKIINLLGQEVSKDTQGVVIFVYADGSIERIVNL